MMGFIGVSQATNVDRQPERAVACGVPDGAAGRRERIGMMAKCPDAERRQLQRMILVGFIALLVPAMIARLTGWRWQPWPPGPQGYSSIIAEAKAAADTYIPLGFIEW